MLDWMQELLGLPESFRSTTASGGGVIQGSASEATLSSILAARWRITEGHVNRDGDTTKLIAYCTSQSHSSIEKGLRIAGIGTQNIRIIEHDASFAMVADALEAQILADQAAGLIRSGCAVLTAQHHQVHSTQHLQSAQSPNAIICGSM